MKLFARGHRLGRLPLDRIQQWIERIPRYILKIIQLLEGGNDYQESLFNILFYDFFANGNVILDIGLGGFSVTNVLLFRLSLVSKQVGWL